MTTNIRRLATIVGVSALGLYAMAISAIAQEVDPVDVVGDGAETLKDTLLTVGVRVLPYAAAVLVLTIGWRFAKRFVRGS